MAKTAGPVQNKTAGLMVSRSFVGCGGPATDPFARALQRTAGAIDACILRLFFSVDR